MCKGPEVGTSWCGLMNSEGRLEWSARRWVGGELMWGLGGGSGSGLRAFKRCHLRDFLGGAVVKNLPANAGDTGSIPGLGRSHMPWSN